MKSSTSSLTALVVDDHPGVRQIVGRMLERLGFSTSMAATVARAEELIDSAEACFDLLVSDIVLSPGLGDELRAPLARRGCDTKILYMTGFTEEELRELDFLDLGATVLTKPFELGELKAAVQDVMDLSFGIVEEAPGEAAETVPETGPEIRVFRDGDGLRWTVWWDGSSLVFRAPEPGRQRRLPLDERADVGTLSREALILYLERSRGA